MAAKLLEFSLVLYQSPLQEDFFCGFNIFICYLHVFTTQVYNVTNSVFWRHVLSKTKSVTPHFIRRLFEGGAYLKNCTRRI